MPTLPWTVPNPPRPGADRVLLMASRFEVRSLRDVPSFLLGSLRIWRQVSRAPGALGASLVAQPLRRTFWTLSAWEGRAELDAFAGSEPHRTVMRAQRPAMAASLFTFWEAPVGELPADWAEARRRLAAAAAERAAD
ncbi:DUF3291 domain-containing protein [Kitasatospora viridis]|uniref:Uncharacterized protein DUF3291 n=1 Tax=Kitasatospora viridis TaxID=281105 RepID=A0A561UJ85_9ACTN|nr:DUF3291 domain-containing protein [Kitasatospora viridis]TWF99438.1 uncharacterized protein DUF3291 [Kitasatospora viridis]